MARYFFSGIAGAGMNPLAQLMKAWGHEVAGSDRGFDQGKQAELKARLIALGIDVVPQDGAGVQPGIERFVYSTAVEQETPEVRRAKQLAIELVPRPRLLSEVVDAGHPGIAIAGTSGKSTITGMLAWILRCAGRPASVLGGAALAGESSREASAGDSSAGPRNGLVVAEACESDGTLIGYHPSFGVIHNISRDHAEVSTLRTQFATFAAQCAVLLVNRGCPEASSLADGHPHAITYGATGPADIALEVIAVGPARARGVVAFSIEPGISGAGRAGGTAAKLVGELVIDLPQPGAHNLENATAAAALALSLGIEPRVIESALATFPGVARRFEVIGTTESGIRVVDDYAHNGEKIRAAIQAAQAGCDRLVAIFQPHGYGPARFLRPELKELLPTVLRPQDRFCYAEIFYAGGTVAKDISSRDLAGDLPAALRCGFVASHAEALSWAADTAIPSDTVLVMGARDPELPKLARALHALL